MNRTFGTMWEAGRHPHPPTAAEAFKFEPEDFEPAVAGDGVSSGIDCELRAEELEAVIAPGMRLQHNETFLL